MRRIKTAHCLVLLVFVNTLVSAALQAQISQFRGPSGNGASDASGIPTSWDSKKNVAWTTEIPGGGWSSPVTAGDLVFVSTAVSKQNAKPKGFGGGVASMRSFSRAKPPQDPYTFELHCLSLTDGKRKWSKVITKRKPPYVIHPSNTYATESPVCDGKFCYVYFAAIGTIACLDLEGNEVWKRELGSFPTGNNFGTGSSLTIAEGKLIVQNDNQKESFLLALDPTTGKDAWRISRKGRTCWSTPMVWQNRERIELVVCGSGYVTSYAPETGKVLWNLTGMGGSFSSSPASDQDRIYFGNSGPGSRGPLVAVEAGATGDLELPRKDQPVKGVAWAEQASGPGMASPVSCQGKLYVVSRGILTCHDAKTGKRLYRSRLQGAANIAASLWSNGDKLFILDESGNTFVVKVGDEFELLSRNSVPGLYWSTPTVVGDSLLLRAADKLHCIRGS